MTEFKEALEAFKRVFDKRADYEHDLFSHEEYIAICKALQQADAQSVDVEGLKREPYEHYVPTTEYEQSIANTGWNDCIDHLKEIGVLRVVEPLPIDPRTDEPLVKVCAEDLVAEYCDAHDDGGYEFNGDDYDIELLTHFAEFIQWCGYLPQPPESGGRG